MFGVDQETILSSLERIGNSIGSLRILLAITLALIISFWLSKIVSRLIVKFGQAIAVPFESTNKDERLIQLRRVETYLSIIIALIRAFIFAGVVFFAVRVAEPDIQLPIAAIGAGTVFVVLAGGAIAPIMRDISVGATMIIEKWFSVGDVIRVEPFMEMSGVVERITLRSTKLRSLSGEIIWLHNQHIQGVRVTPWGVRTMAVDVFVSDVDKATKIAEEVIKTLPTGPTMLAQPLRIMKPEKLANDMWRLTITGQTTPGREWLMEKFLVDSLKEADDKNGEDKTVIMHGPLVRFADEVAERRFRRAVRMAKQGK